MVKVKKIILYKKKSMIVNDRQWSITGQSLIVQKSLTDRICILYQKIIGRMTDHWSINDQSMIVQWLPMSGHWFQWAVIDLNDRSLIDHRNWEIIDRSLMAQWPVIEHNDRLWSSMIVMIGHDHLVIDHWWTLKSTVDWDL